MQSYLPEIEPPIWPHMRRPFSIRARFGSFRHAANGIVGMLRHEHNSRVHLAATGAVVGAGAWCRIALDEWRWLFLAIGLVWMAEAFNSAIEWLCDLISPGFHPAVKRIKDVAAGAVLVSALVAAAIGTTVFWPFFTGVPGS